MVEAMMLQVGLKIDVSEHFFPIYEMVSQTLPSMGHWVCLCNGSDGMSGILLWSTFRLTFSIIVNNYCRNTLVNKKDCDVWIVVKVFQSSQYHRVHLEK